MNNTKIIAILLFFLTLFSFSITSAEQPYSLTAAIYKYIPDTKRFETAVREEWSTRHPDIELEFVDWDCYSQEVPEDLDVFFFENINVKNSTICIIIIKC